MQLPLSLRELATPRRAYTLIQAALPTMTVLTVLVFFIGLSWALFLAPPDFRQGDVYRIMFVHVPAASCAENIYVVMAIAGGIHLVWNVKLANLLLRAAAPIGLSMAIITIISGAIWGKPTWGAFWVWDARLTSMLVLAMLYLVIIYLHLAIQNSRASARASSVVTIIGLINIPIIKFSVEWWFSLHQPASLTLAGASMPPSMWSPLLFMILAFNLCWLTLLFIRLSGEILTSEQNSKWARQLTTN